MVEGQVPQVTATSGCSHYAETLIESVGHRDQQKDGVHIFSELVIYIRATGFVLFDKWRDLSLLYVGKLGGKILKQRVTCYARTPKGNPQCRVD